MVLHQPLPVDTAIHRKKLNAVSLCLLVQMYNLVVGTCLQVFTSDIRGAGTDANVSIVLYGAGGRNSGPLRLENSKNNFERGAEDIFFSEPRDLGPISEVEIGHDNSGPSPGWHLEQVVVVEETSNQRYAFACDRYVH